jgi:hypothetical protein
LDRLRQTSALERILKFSEGPLPREVAEYFLSLAFSPDDHSRFQELSLKAQESALTTEERAELEDLLMADDVLALSQSQARLTLNRPHPWRVDE